MFWRKWPPASKLLAALAVICGAAAFLLIRAESARVGLALGYTIPKFGVADVKTWAASTRLYKALAESGLQIECKFPTPARLITGQPPVSGFFVFPAR